MEFVRVLYPTHRTVEIDDTECGFTNEVLLVESGMHRFDLGEPADYEPAFKEVNVVDTIPSRPMSVLFDVIVTTPAAPPAGAEGSSE